MQRPKHTLVRMRISTMFRNLMYHEEVEEGRADYAVLPIENSTAGFVINNYDLLLKYKNYIVGEIYVPVAHMLLGVPGAKLS